MNQQVTRQLQVAFAVLGALVSISACSKTSEERRCNSGTVLVEFTCEEGLDKVQTKVDLAAANGQTATREFELSCPGSYNLEVAVTDYAEDQQLRADVTAVAGERTLLNQKRFDIDLDPGCTRTAIKIAQDTTTPDDKDAAVVEPDAKAPVDGPVVNPDATGLARGQGCLRDDQCTDGHCADGVCCESACDGTCMACSSAKTGSTDGTCTFTKSGERHTACAAEPAESCLTTGACNGAGACTFWGSDQICKPARCESNNFISAQKCNGTGACQPPSPSECREYACTAQGCKDVCDAPADCSPGVQCINKKCGGKLALGEKCSSNGQCSGGGFCVDGVCCGSACSGKCEACSAAATGGKDGECLPIPTSKGAQAECDVQSAGSCGTTGRCDGSRKCEFHAAGTECVGAMCSANAYTASRKCDGSGSCLTVTTMPCGAHQCSSSGCRTPCASDSDCITGNYCEAGVCKPKKSNGGMCTAGANNQCQSSICADGFCCGTACNGTCDSCSSGTCSNACQDVVLTLVNTNSGHVSDGLFGAVTNRDTFSIGEGNLVNPTNPNFRDFLTFDLSTLPTGARIIKAELVVRMGECSSEDWSSLGSILLEDAEWGPTLEKRHFDDAGVSASTIFASSTTDQSLPVIKDVTAWVAIDLTNRQAKGNRTQFRLRFERLNDQDDVVESCALYNTVIPNYPQFDLIRLRLKYR